MRILYIAPSTERVPPYRYGAVGRIVDHLVQGCFEHGQDIDLIASGDSRTRARALLPSTDYPVRNTDAVRSRVLDLVRTTGVQYDVIHNHDSTLAPDLESVRDVKVITTCHLEQQDVWCGLSRQWLIALSADQAGRIGGGRVLDTIPPCINISEFDLTRRDDQGYLLVLSKLSEKKGILDAIRIAKASSRPLLLAGPVFPKDRSFYAEAIAPEIDGKQIVYYGEAVESERRELLRHASALLFPNLYGEPFGVVLLEALASGVPTVATGNNAASEVVEHGRTGFLASGVAAAATFVDRLSVIDPVACRLSAERYDYNVVSASYLRAYNRLVGSGVCSAGCGRSPSTVFLLRGNVPSDGRRAVTAALRGATTGGVASLSVGPWAFGRSLGELARTLPDDAENVLLWDERNELERPVASPEQRTRMIDVTLLGRAADPLGSHDTGGVENFRALIPSTLLSFDLPTDRFVQQLLALKRVRLEHPWTGQSR